MLDETDTEEEYVPLLPNDKRKCAVVADFVTIQCILVILGSSSILGCVWSPDGVITDYDKLVRIMYLFDSHACGYKLMMTKEFPNLKFSNDTRGHDVIPIQWTQAVTTVTTRLTEKTRFYITLSLSFHCIWLFIIFGIRIIIKKSKDVRKLNFALAIFLYTGILMLLFDTSMALVYISHIKQSLTKGMVLRYSGWSNTLKLQSYDEFGGWLSIAASFSWLRGGIFFLINVYGCRTIQIVRRKIRKRQIKMKYENARFMAIPEARAIYADNRKLIYRSGEQYRNVHFQK